MKIKVVLLIFIGLAALIGWHAATLGDSNATQQPLSSALDTSGLSKAPMGQGNSRPIDSIQVAANVQVADQKAFAARLAKMPLTGLLAEFELSGDLRFLESARAKHGKDPRFLMAAALASQSPESAELKTLEKNQPDNALPNILRAGMYAQINNWKGLKEQLDLAIAKQSLSSSDLERKAAVLDLVISDPNRANSEAIKSKLDAKFFGQVESIERALQRNPTLFGGSVDTASMGIGLAIKLRNMGENDFSAGLLSDNIELGLLKRVNQADPNYLYGDTGLTVRQRMDQITNAAAEKKRWSALLTSVFQPTTDLNTRVRFFARVRADGEMAALSWLNQMRSTTTSRP